MRQVEEELIELYGPDAIKPDKTVNRSLPPGSRKATERGKNELNLLKQRQQMLHASEKKIMKNVWRGFLKLNRNC